MTTDPSRLAPRLYQQAAAALAREVEQGLLPPGAILTQGQLVQRFGISRSPARQALEELARLGLLERQGAARFSVAANSVQPVPRPAPADPVRLTPRAGWEMLYPEIEMEIVSRSSLGSWRVNEAMLARHCGVSRTVARDVVGRLQNRGIIRKDDSGRWFAPALTARHIDELFELRWLLEPVAMEKALPHLPGGLLDQMLAELEAAMAPDAHRDSALLDHLEQRLHVEMLGHCGNDALIRAIRLPQSLLIAHHMLYQLTLELFGTEPFLTEHREVVLRLLSGDIAGARAALVAHLRISRRRAMLRIEAVQEMIQPDPLPYLERIDPA
ncbi:GntR family transcriptional regulator [Paracoccus sp. CPCC 101403]|uniref:GntR family transcriptional regulator n=1 Tax=Paracoccus broussonetiae TaxID=3075834 RepID=A0ABU3EB03_9RHOB|nr:GntR family transcriptional regulator [Paracoccus sp. CPCC 101403]MDT1061398.1 GntR family transcriptional regulator [Paracoccus sp. CPCC 101403]